MKTILIIDDEQDFSFFIKANLELTGKYKVITASTGMEGLKAAQTQGPDLVLLDVMMPDMDGIATLKKFRENEKTMYLPVVLLTAKNDTWTKLKAATLCNMDYIVKPVEIELLKSKIDSILSSY